MPELPEVETARRQCERILRYKTIVRAKIASDDRVIEGISPAALTRRLRGREVKTVGRKGKYFWLELDRGFLLCHLGMSGQVHTNVESLPRFWKWALYTEAGDNVVFTNIRRIGRVRWLKDLDDSPALAKLGWDVLAEQQTAEWLHRKLQRRGAPIKAVLLDQSLFAGVGNWIADEVLYQARLSPHTKANELNLSEVRRVRRKLRSIIRKAVSVYADERSFPSSWLFHRRWGKVAGTVQGYPIQFDTVGGRTTAWVPALQLPPDM